jgi:ATP-binding cassette subfamily B protein
MSPCHPSVKELRQLAPFVRLSRQELRRLGQLGVTISFTSGTVLARQGHLCREFVILIEGRAQESSDGHEIAVLEAGQHFGALAIIRGIHNPLTIVARTPVTLKVMTAREFLSAYTTMPPLRTYIDRHLESWSDPTPSWPPDSDGMDLGTADEDPYTLAS